MTKLYAVLLLFGALLTAVWIGWILWSAASLVTAAFAMVAAG
jgi:hypothetical protein